MQINFSVLTTWAISLSFWATLHMPVFARVERHEDQLGLSSVQQWRRLQDFLRTDQTTCLIGAWSPASTNTCSVKNRQKFCWRNYKDVKLYTPHLCVASNTISRRFTRRDEQLSVTSVDWTHTATMLTTPWAPLWGQLRHDSVVFLCAQICHIACQDES